MSRGISVPAFLSEFSTTFLNHSRGLGLRTTRLETGGAKQGHAPHRNSNSRKKNLIDAKENGHQLVHRVVWAASAYFSCYGIAVDSATPVNGDKTPDLIYIHLADIWYMSTLQPVTVTCLLSSWLNFDLAKFKGALILGFTSIFGISFLFFIQLWEPGHWHTEVLMDSQY